LLGQWWRFATGRGPTQKKKGGTNVKLSVPGGQ
jgi:hypothetical protein